MFHVEHPSRGLDERGVINKIDRPALIRVITRL
jgi:hypothetical protein